jgi:hypothetical protein
MAQAIIAGPVEDVAIGDMPDARSQAEELVAFESKLRSAVLAMDREHVERLASTLRDAPGDFFADTRRLFTAGAAARLGWAKLEQQMLGGLPPDWRILLGDLAHGWRRSIAQQ